MGDKPLVSVIMPCYNHSKYVGQAIESVLGQTYENFELLISDDGSTDGSAEIIKSYTDERITFFEYKENTGFAAWEYINCCAKGKYIACIASDDMWRKDKLEKQVRFLEENSEYEACFTWIDTLDGDSTIATGTESKNAVFNVSLQNSDELFRILFLKGNCLSAPSFMMNNHVFQELEGFRFKYRQLQDWDLWLRYLLNHKIYIIPEKLTLYRWHEKDGTSNISAGSRGMMIRTWNETFHIIGDLVEQMEDDFFVRVFEEYLIKKSSATHEEVMCEKVFLLLNHPIAEAQQCAINYYFNHIDNYEFAVCMEEVYGFPRSDFYEIEAKRGIMKVMYDYMENAEKSKKVVHKALECIKELKG